MLLFLFYLILRAYIVGEGKLLKKKLDIMKLLYFTIVTQRKGNH